MKFDGRIAVFAGQVAEERVRVHALQGWLGKEGRLIEVLHRLHIIAQAHELLAHVPLIRPFRRRLHLLLREGLADATRRRCFIVERAFTRVTQGLLSVLNISLLEALLC